MDSNLLAVGALICRRPRLRLHQRFSRRGQFDCHGCLDARALARQGGHLGGVLQFRGGLHLRHGGRQDRRRRPRRLSTSSRFSVIFAGLIGAIVWDLITWYSGCRPAPRTRSSAATPERLWPRRGFAAMILSGWTKTLIFIVLAPLIGLVLAFVIMVGDPVDVPAGPRQAAWTSGSDVSSSFRRRLTASATAVTTRRRRWGSSPARWWPAAT